MTYDVSPKLSITGVLANLVNTCWGGTKAPWTFNNGNVCGYVAGGYGGEIFPVGNIYNPAGFNGSIVQPLVKYPYNPLFGRVQPKYELYKDPVPVLRNGGYQDLVALAA